MVRRNALILAVPLMLAACGQPETEEPVAEATAMPEASAAPTPPAASPELVAWLRTNYADMDDILYLSGETDLDGDGIEEILAYVGGRWMCGSGGCNLVVLQRTGQGLEKVGDLSVSRLPAGVFASSTNGWRDLAVTISGGGIQGGVARVPFGEGRYASNPTVPPATITEEPFETVIAEGPLTPLGQ